MKYFQKITLSLLAIVVVALGSNATATTHTFDPDSADITDTGVYTSAGDSIVVNDEASANGTGKAVILTGASTVPLDVLHGILKVGNSLATGSVDAIASTGANTVENGAILEITAATANCIPGATEVKSGGILQVDDGVEVPATSALYLFLANSVYDLKAKSAVTLPLSGYSNPTAANNLLCSYVTDLPAGCAITTSTGLVTPPAGASVSINGFHLIDSTTVSIPYGFHWDDDSSSATYLSITCDPSIIAVTSPPISSSTIDTATGIITLPAGWDFDGVNLYNAGVKDILFPTGMHPSTLTPYTKISDSSPAAVGAIIGDMFGATLQVDSGAIIKLGAGSVWQKDISVVASDG